MGERNAKTDIDNVSTVRIIDKSEVKAWVWGVFLACIQIAIADRMKNLLSVHGMVWKIWPLQEVNHVITPLTPACLT
jgi:hypothetical protein